MSILLLVSISLLLAGVAAAAVLWVRSGETRVGVVGVLFVLIAALQVGMLWARRGEPWRLDSTAFGELAALGVALASLWVLVAFWRTLGERDRAEALHWDSMEAVRTLNELTSRPGWGLDAKLEELLELGVRCFGLPVGLIARVRRERYEVVAIRAPRDYPVRRGAVFALGETLCGRTLASDRAIGIERISGSGVEDARTRAAFGFEAYLGAAIRLGETSYGTLSFGSTAPRGERFTATEKDLVRMMAQWLGAELERAEPARSRPVGVAVAAVAPTERPAPTPGPTQERGPGARAAGPRAPDRGRRIRRAPEVDVNATLRRLEKDLHALAGRALRLELRLDPKVGIAAAQRVPLDAIVRTLVMNARDAMPEGGAVTVETANLELGGAEPGVIPAVVPDRYVTISVRDAGIADAETLSRLFDTAPATHPESRRPDPEGRLPLSTVYRVLQVCGGDLSVDVEPGRGSTYTVYLPRAEAARSTRPAAAAEASRAAGPSVH